MSEVKEKVLVFGGAGFLGSHVADELTRRGFQVTLFDREPSQYLQEGQEMIVGDLLDELKVREVLQGIRYVYNFSGVTSIDECADAPISVIKNNVLAHTILLEQCRLQGIERLVFASSIYVYSKHGSFYKISKQTCEQLTQEYFEKFGLAFTILRYGSLYGPRAQNWNGVQKYLTQAVEEGKIDYPGTGDERREYIHAYDAARLSVDILEEEFQNKNITVTGNYSLTSKELLSMITEMLSNKVELNFTNEKLFHHYTITPYSYTPQMALKLNPNPSIDMGEGLLRQIEEIHKGILQK